MLQQLNKILAAALLSLGGWSVGADDAPILDGSDIKGVETVIASARSTSGWRALAQQRIRKHRMSDLTVEVIDSKGRVVPEALVFVDQTDQEFDFGVVIRARMLNEIKDLVPHFGNQIGFNNALKYKHRKNLAPYAETAIKWARANGLGVRGHVLVYPGWKFMQKDAQKYSDGSDPEGLRRLVDAQIIDYAARWDVDAWDAVNETVDNQDLQAILGRQELVRWFKLARQHARNPDIPLYLNENRIVSALPVQKDRMTPFLKDVEYLLENDAPITHLGLQSRFRTDSITPEEMLRRLDQVAAYGLPITATEFEISASRDKRLPYQPSAFEKARLAEEVMTAYFSHPAVDGIVFWTFVTHTDEQKGLLNSDLTLAPVGKVWLHLVNDLWRTQVLTETGEDGRITVRAFRGEYDIKVEHKGMIYSVAAKLGETDRTIKVRLK